MARNGEKNFRCDKSVAKNCIAVVIATEKVLAILQLSGKRFCRANAIQYYRSLQFNHMHKHSTTQHNSNSAFTLHRITFSESDAHDRVDNSRTKGSIDISFPLDPQSS